MLQPIDLVLLDLGNTLYYDPEPWPDILKAAEAALWSKLRAAGVKAEPSEIYGQYETLIDLYNSDHRKDLSEPTTRRILRERLQATGYPIGEADLRAALRAMYGVTQQNWLLEPEALPLLQELRRRGFRLGVITNAADEDNTQTLIDKGGIRPYLEFILSSAAFGRRKPDGGIFLAALEHFRLGPERAVMVGDTYEADIVGGKGVGIHTIWIRHAGIHASRAYPEADAQVTSLREIPDLISRDTHTHE